MATPRRRLSEHFAAAEFDCHDGTRWMLPHRVGYEHLCLTFLEPMRDRFGVCRVLSGYRTPAYNRRVGGAANSYHVNDLHPGHDVAADVRFLDGNVPEWFAMAREIRQHERNGRGGLGRYPGSGFLHIDTRDWRADWIG